MVLKTVLFRLFLFLESARCALGQNRTTNASLTPSYCPTPFPSTEDPSLAPTLTLRPTTLYPPSVQPTTSFPTTLYPTTRSPTAVPSASPTWLPVMNPTVITYAPTAGLRQPAAITESPSTPVPSQKPSTTLPSSSPTHIPTFVPTTATPTITPAPSAVPTTSLPSLPPTTSIPTALPTREPDVTILPSNITYPTLLKPQDATAEIYLVNLNERPLEQFCIALLVRDEDTFGEVVIPSYTITLDDSTNLQVAAYEEFGIPFSISNRVGRNSQTARLRIFTRGLDRGRYTLEFITGNTFVNEDGVCLPELTTSQSRQTLFVSITVETEADPSKTIVLPRNDSSLRGNQSTVLLPVLGTSFEPIIIEARDLDGTIVHWEDANSFAVTVSAIGAGRSNDARATCDVFVPIPPSVLYYDVRCTLPNIEDAGIWMLQVFLRGTLIWKQNLTVICPVGTYLDLDNKCRECFKDLVCLYPGLTLQTVQLEDDYWRATPDSTKLYDCELDATCRGPETEFDPVTGIAFHNAHGNSLCRHKHAAGILCNVCRKYSRYDSASNRCVSCGSSQARTIRFAILLTLCFFGLLLLAWLWHTCASRRGAQAALTAAAVEAIRGGTGASVRAMEERKLEQDEESEAETKEEKKARRRQEMLDRLRQSLFNKLKILIASAQILSSMPWIFRIRFPPVAEEVSSSLSFFNFNLLDLITVRCLSRHFNFYRTLVIQTVTPAVISFIILLISIARINKVSIYFSGLRLERISHRIHRMSMLRTSSSAKSETGGGGPPASEEDPSLLDPTAVTMQQKVSTKDLADTEKLDYIEQKRKAQIINQGIFCFLVTTFLVFPSVSTTVFTFFSCTTFRENDGDQGRRSTSYVLQIDYSISCRSRHYKGAMSIYAFLCLALYPCGIPLCYFCMLFRHRKDLNPEITHDDILKNNQFTNEEKHFFMTMGRELGFIHEIFKMRHRVGNPKIAHLTFLYEEYEPRVFWFSIVDCIRRLALTSLLVFLYPGSSTQIGFATLFAIIFARVYSQTRPYIADEDDLVAEIAAECLVLLFFLTLMLYFSKSCDTNADGQTSAATSVFAANVFSAVYIIVVCFEFIATCIIILIEVFGYDKVSSYFFAKSKNDQSTENTNTNDKPTALSPTSDADTLITPQAENQPKTEYESDNDSEIKPPSIEEQPSVVNVSTDLLVNMFKMQKRNNRPTLFSAPAIWQGYVDQEKSEEPPVIDIRQPYWKRTLANIGDEV